MTDYRRGVEREQDHYVSQKLWHFDEACEDFPTRNFAIQHDKPLIDDLCRRCRSATVGG